MAHRTQAERSQKTTTALITAGIRLFGRDGYTATSIESITTAAGMTKGAAYYHFDGKIGLFREVFVAYQRYLTDTLARIGAGAPDTWSALRAGCHAFLRHCLDQNTRQIVLLDGPAVLGWDTVREIEYQYILLTPYRGITAAAADGRTIEGDPAVRCQLLFGALCEAGLLLARSDDPNTTLPAVLAEADHVLNAFARRP